MIFQGLVGEILSDLYFFAFSSEKCPKTSLNKVEGKTFER